MNYKQSRRLLHCRPPLPPHLSPLIPLILSVIHPSPVHSPDRREIEIIET